MGEGYSEGALEKLILKPRSHFYPWRFFQLSSSDTHTNNGSIRMLNLIGPWDQACENSRREMVKSVWGTKKGVLSPGNSSLLY